MEAEQPEKSLYTVHWDDYVDVEWDWLRGEREDLHWPGDEWGSPEYWERSYQGLFVEAGGVESWERAVEIGQGSGKYTLEVLANPGVQVRAYDVSTRFLEICRQRCEEQIREGRLSLHHLDAMVPDQLLSDLTACGWRRKVDALYSIDVMVHVDLQYLIVYLVTAGAVLRPGGKLVINVASATTDAGFKQLLEGIQLFWQAQAFARGSGKFEWVNAAMIESLLPRLGFEIDVLEESADWAAVPVVASLREPEASEELLPFVVSPPDASDEGQ